MSLKWLPENFQASSTVQNSWASPCEHTHRAPLQETHSKAKAVGEDVKMKNDVSTHKTKVKEKEKIWKWNSEHEKRRVSKRRWFKKVKDAERLKCMHVVVVLTCSHLSCQHTQFTVNSVIIQGVDTCLHSPFSPGSNVIILSAPAPVLVREAVHLHILVWGHCGHPTKILWVRQPRRVTTPMYTLMNSVTA